MGLTEFSQKFGTPEACLEQLKKIRWKDGEFCPIAVQWKRFIIIAMAFAMPVPTAVGSFASSTERCSGIRKLRCCPNGSRLFGLKRTTVRVISSVQLAKMIGTTQKTAWFMLQRIRNAFSNKDDDDFLSGIVE